MFVPGERLGGAVARVVSGRARRRRRRKADRGAVARCRSRYLPHRRHRAGGARPLLASRRRAQPWLGGGRHHRLPLSRLPLRTRWALHAGAGASGPADLAEAPHRHVPDGGALRADLVHAERSRPELGRRREPAGVRGVGRSRVPADPGADHRHQRLGRTAGRRLPRRRAFRVGAHRVRSARAPVRSCPLTKSSAPRAASARSM